MRVLGIPEFYEDRGAALVRDGEIVCAAQEERFTRRKHDPSLPVHAIEYCLPEEQVRLGAPDFIVFYDKPFLKFERLLETYLALAPKGLGSFSRAFPVWVKEKLFQKRLLLDALKQFGGVDRSARLLFAEHHLSHAASAFYPSPFQNALIITMDWRGEWATPSALPGPGHNIY